jgi:hypothetical protein
MGGVNEVVLIVVLDTLYIGGWLAFRVRLEFMEKRKISCPSWE